MQNKDVESITADLFPRIHLKTSQKELDDYRDKIVYLIDIYSKHFDVSSIIKDKDILEVGCGGRASGIYALEILRPNFIRAVDLSEKNIENTRNLCNELGYKNVNIQQGNALKLDFSDNSFDFIFSNGVIHHTTDTYQCFLEMTRALKPGGHLFLGIYGYGGLWGHIIHPLIMLIGKMIPLNITEKIVNKTGFMSSQDRSLLDFLYTPIQNKTKKNKVISWFRNNNFDNVLRIKSPRWFYNMGIMTNILFGDGYIYIIGKKK